MKNLHISDIALNLPYKTISDSPENLITLVKEHYADTNLFLINVNYQSQGVARSDNAGIQFLKFLRLHHIHTHCVLYSFLSREQLMVLDTCNLILFSKGVTFIRLPEDLSILDFNLLAQLNAPSDLSKFFKAEFNLPDDRHNWANWWGIERLWEVHQAVINKKKEDIADYINSPFIKKMNSIEALTGRYLFPVNKEQLAEEQKKSEKEKIELRNILLNNILRTEKKRLNESEKNKYKKEIKDCEAKIYALEINFNSANEIRKLRSLIAEQPRKIILIDDQSAEGWASVFRNILYNEQNKLYENLTDPEINENNTFLASIKEDTDIVLLDLRLKNEIGHYNDISELSGVIILKIIIERFPGLPVVVISASNKLTSYRTVMDLGADAFWVKEGLDSRFNEREIFENYNNFLELIARLSGKEYKLLKTFAIQVEKLKEIENPWWRDHVWESPAGNTNITITKNQGKNVSRVSELLDYGVMLYRNWLRMFILNSSINHQESVLAP